MSLPPELWLQGMDALYDRTSHIRSYDSEGQKALKNASLVCEAFREMAQPIIFHRLNLEMIEEDIMERVRGIHDLLNSQPESQTWIRLLRFKGNARRPLRFCLVEAR